MHDASDETPDSAVAAIRDNQQVLGFMLALHGLVHVIGFLLAWRIYAPRSFSYADVWPEAGTWPGRLVGMAWIVVGVSIVVVGARMTIGRGVHPAWLAGSMVASVAVCLTALPDAAPGALASGAVLASMAFVKLRRHLR